MKKNLDFTSFKKEFLEEIENHEVSVEQLKKNKVGLATLEAESVLRKVFGDEIYISKQIEEKVEGEKEILKLSEEDIAFDGIVRDICENVIDQDFDSGLSVVMSKMSDREG